MTQREEYMDLALGLLQDTLAPDEKKRALLLIESDREFLAVLQLELALKNELASLKTPLPEGEKKQLYLKIKGSVGQVLYKAVLHTVLNAVMPKMLWPVMRIFERSVFANEQL
ncbi:MAG: hypothetical protein GX101_07270 [Firmicutes bacterium]|jgi:hypothetical protein|nr:hypothetical protein [Bacillota bacterium]NLO66476.1 hypothetical protein [Bacillota bacterium]